MQCHREEIDELPDVIADKVHLLPGMLSRSRADNTCKKYELAFLRWKKWCLCNGLGSGDILPAKAFPVAIYLASVIQSANSPSPVITAFYAIKWFHEISGLNSPTDSKLVSNILESARRILAKPTVKKIPVDTSLLLSMYRRLYEEGNLKSQRILCACLIAFAGFLRSDELLNIRVSDLRFEQSYMKIFIESSKTDKFRDGAWIVIAKTGTLLCPVTNVQKFISWSGLSNDDYLFCNLSKTKEGFKVRKSNVKTSYTNLREQFLKALKPHVTDVSKYCLHSLRSGGASAAANSGVKDRLFKRHGRWISEFAKDGYVADNLEERLSVSLSLGL